MIAKKDLLSLNPAEIIELMNDMGEKPFRGKQIFKWLHRGINSFDDMNNLPKDIRGRLAQICYIEHLQVIKKLNSSDKNTIKYLFLLKDNNIIECVAMKYKHGYTLCLSTQIGCRMGCEFCASTKDGLIRNMTPGEMVSQVMEVNNDLTGDRGERIIKNIVLMGSGEPLDNYGNTMKFLELIHHSEGINISYRNITLSTCGIVPKIRDLADEKKPVTLSVSLHAPNDEIRAGIMPIGAVYKINDIIDACHYFFDKTGRRVTFEYALIDGVNDMVVHGEELASRLKGFPCHVNVIPVNPIEEYRYNRSRNDSIDRFIEVLKKRNITVTKRREMGTDIEGACGQLRKSYLSNKI